MLQSFLSGSISHLRLRITSRSIYKIWCIMFTSYYHRRNDLQLILSYKSPLHDYSFTGVTASVLQASHLRNRFYALEHVSIDHKGQHSQHLETPDMQQSEILNTDNQGGLDLCVLNLYFRPSTRRNTQTCSLHKDLKDNKYILTCARPDTLTIMSMKNNTTFGDVTPCSLAELRPYSSKTLVNFY
jgi:hypothetical protein